MYPVTDAFLAQARQTHTVIKRLDVCTPDGTVLTAIDATGGDITIDTKRAIRREASFTVPDIGGLTPAAPGDLLSNLSGNEVRPWRGLQLPDGTTELVPLGVFPIRSCPTTSGPGGTTITLGVKDRASTVTRNKWTAPYTIAAGTPLEDALTALLLDRAPLYPVNFPATGITVPATTFGLDTGGGDPWADAQALAKASGYDLYYDVTGTAVLTQPTDPTTAVPVITYADDATSATIDAAKDWDAELAFNGCVAIGEGSSTTPVRAEVWDDDPDSPTHYLGPYGRYPEFIVSPAIGTADQALAAATSQLARRRGVAQTVEWTQLVNPAHDGDDAIAFAHARLRIDEPLTVVLDTLTIPWSATAGMRAASRSRQVAL